jgi:regulator of sigma E protease
MSFTWDLLRFATESAAIGGTLVFLHEVGHFIAAKLHGVRVLRLSLGIGPRILRMKRGGTEYWLRAVPLGGYVRLAGETDDQELTGGPEEFLSRSRKTRAQIYAAGPIVNLLVAWLVLAAVLMRGNLVPESFLEPVVIGAVEEDAAAHAAGLKIGDRIVSVNGNATPTWEALSLIVPQAPRLELQIDRAGVLNTFVVPVAPDGRRDLTGLLGVAPTPRPVVDQVVPGEAADRAGLRTGDVIVELEGRKVDREAFIQTVRSNQGNTLRIVVERGGEDLTLGVTPGAGDLGGRIGALIGAAAQRNVPRGLGEALWLSVRENWNQVRVVVGPSESVTRPESPRQLSGPVQIASLDDLDAESWAPMLRLLAALSLTMGLVSFVPLPWLDGAPLLILAIEGVKGRDLAADARHKLLAIGGAVGIALSLQVVADDLLRISWVHSWLPF